MTKTKRSRRTIIAGLAGGLAPATRVVPARSQNRSLPMDTTIRTGDDIATLINIFTVEPENQQKLVQLLNDGTKGFFSKMTGWISTNLLTSKDGRRVILYSQWRSLGDVDAFRQNPNFGSYVQGITAIAKFESITCDVAAVHHA
jgi:heme-degrading monooxygenase HmoA